MRRLEWLDLSENWMTRAGIAALQATGVKMAAANQHPEGDRNFLYASDWE